MSKFTVNPNAAGIVADVTIAMGDLIRADLSGIAYRLRVPVAQFAFDSEEDKATVVPKDESGREAGILFVDIDRDIADALADKNLPICGKCVATFGVDEVKSPTDGSVTTLLRVRATPDAVTQLTEKDVLTLVQKRSERIAAAKARKAAESADAASAAPDAN